MPQKSNNNEGVSREKVKNIGADYGYAEERVREVLQSVGIRPKDLSRINFAAELKSRVGGNADVDAGSGREGGEVGNDGSVPGSGTDKGRVVQDGGLSGRQAVEES